MMTLLALATTTRSCVANNMTGHRVRDDRTIGTLALVTLLVLTATTKATRSCVENNTILRRVRGDYTIGTRP
jgi:hypothetical protein